MAPTSTATRNNPARDFLLSLLEIPLPRPVHPPANVVSITCDVCDKVPWGALPPEDDAATPHHKSRRALENSAQTCVLCRLVLRAAVSNYRDSQGVRHGEGYWRESYAAQYNHRDQYQLRSESIMLIKEIGACRPATRTEFNNLTGSIVQDIPSFSDIDGERLRTMTREYTIGGVSPSLTLPSGIVDSNGHHLAFDSSSKVPNLDALELDSPRLTENLPVWLYGNWWAESELKEVTLDDPSYRIVGIGARFGRSPSPFDAYNARLGELKLCGSALSICIADG